MFSKEKFDNFIEYLYLVNAEHYYVDNYGTVRSQTERVLVRFLPHINHFGIVKKNNSELDVIVVDENSNLQNILSKITNDTYIVNRNDLTCENYSNYGVLDQLYPNESNTKKGLFRLFKRAS